MILERNSERAAAYATLSAVIECRKTTLAATGETRIHFLLGPHWKDPATGSRQSLPRLRSDLKKGTLAPTHPLCRLLLASENRRLFISYLATPSLGLLAVPHHGAQRLIHGTGHTLPGIHSPLAKTAGVFKTTHLRTAVALLTAGHTLLAIDGQGKNCTFYLTHVGPEGPATQLIHAWLNQPHILPSGSVFLFAIAFLHNREHLTAHINHLLGRIILKKPNDPKHRSIEIAANASGKTWDKAKRFLLG